MQKFWSIMTTLVLAAPLMAHAATQSGPTQKADPAIGKIVDTYLAAVKARDAAKVAEIYTKDAVEMPPHRKPAKGKAAIRNYYEQQFRGEMAEFSDLKLDSTGSRASGDIAYDTGQYSQRITPKGGKPIEDSGNYVVILHRTGGEWKVAYAIYNSHMGQPGATADKKQ